MLRIPECGRYVSQEPANIATHLLGHPLATFRRQTCAFLLDLLLLSLVFGTIFTSLTLMNTNEGDPTLIPRIRARMPGAAPADSSAFGKLALDILTLVEERVPLALDCDLSELVAARDLEGLSRESLDNNLMVSLTSGATRVDTEQILLGSDFLLGRYGSFLGWGAFFVAWFTLWSRLLQGRTPGKAVFGLEAVKLDGKPLSWWDAFSRSAGNGASAGTLLLGYFEAIWHPNRQAVHDRISNTVVVRRKQA